MSHTSNKTGASAWMLGRRLVSDQRLRLLAIVVLGTMALLSLQRFLIFAVLDERFSDLALGEVARGFLVGLRFDLVIGCSIAAPMAIALLLFPRQLLERRKVRLLLVSYAAFSLILVGILATVDFYFFEEFYTRLDQKVFQYLEYGYVLKIVFEEYPVGTLATGALIAFVVLVRLLDSTVVRSNRTVTFPSLVLFPLVAALFTIGIRGSIGPKPINTGLAYFSGSVPLAQLSLNGLFTLREAIDSAWRRRVPLASLHPLQEESEALTHARSLLATPQDEFLNDPQNPLLRTTHTGREQKDYNVVLVVMESHSWHYIGAMGGDARVSPNLDALASEGILFDHCFAVGDRTVFGFSGIVGGFPDLPGSSVTTRHESEGQFLTIGKVLEARGYDTVFVYGGSPLYDHRGAFLGSNGFERQVFGEQFESKTFRTHLGWSDEDLFAQADREFRKMSSKPFLGVVLTLTFHRPYLFPEGRITPFPESEPNAKQLNAIRYADWAIGQFMEQAKQSPYFKDTIFVFAADHTGGARGNTMRPTSYRVPFLVYAPEILGTEGRRVETTCSQTDIAPTIMSLLGGSYTHTFFGSSVLDRSPEHGFALMQFGTRSLAYINNDRELLLLPYRTGNEALELFRFNPPEQLTPFESPERASALERDAIALLQSADILYHRGAYDLPSQALSR